MVRQLGWVTDVSRRAQDQILSTHYAKEIGDAVEERKLAEGTIGIAGWEWFPCPCL